MAQKFAKAFYNSKAWKACRESYIADRLRIDGGKCEICQKELGYIVHHKIKLTPKNITNPQITLSFENLEYTCKECHDIEHYEDIFGKKIKKTRCNFDTDGQPLPPFES